MKQQDTLSAYKRTRLVVAASIAGSILSLATIQAGWGELYPFFTWKLYTQPLGSKRTVSEYRIYTLDKETRQWQRQPVTPTAVFPMDDYVYTLNTLTKATLQDPPSSTAAKAKLYSFITFVTLQADVYKVVQETYAPRQLLTEPENYDTLTVVRFRN